MNKFIFTSESVTKGHPDKVCDMISDAILDAYLAQDAKAHVACETMAKNNDVYLLGEITSTAHVDIDRIVRQTVLSIGYDKDDYGFNGHNCAIHKNISVQSPDIAMGVNQTRDEEIGAGDQGLMFGYASDETESFMPLPISLAHALAKQLTKVREDKTLDYLRPDGKTQVSVAYEDNKVSYVDTVLVSTQTDDNIDLKCLKQDIIDYVIKPIIPSVYINDKTKFLVNPTGRFVIGGPVGDSGLTGRKIIVDTYGGSAHHGGGAFSGKDPSKVDRSASYYARYIAKNIVAAGLAHKAEVQIAYAIGVAQPVSLCVNTFGTGIISDEDMATIVNKNFDCRPGMIVKQLNLRTPIYGQTASYGHFGRTDLNLPWEQLDKVNILKEELKNYKRANIASFTVNHDTLTPGLYVSRIDNDIITYDVRMKKPNTGDVISPKSIHTLEHLLATYLRSTALSQDIIYVGPMGCRTGMYVVTRNSLNKAQVLESLKEAFNFTQDFEGIIPGSQREQCGNYLEHDLPQAKKDAQDYLKILNNWTVEKMHY